MVARSGMSLGELLLYGGRQLWCRVIGEIVSKVKPLIWPASLCGFFLCGNESSLI